MSNLLVSLWAFLTAGGGLLATVILLVQPWLPLAVWAAFWLFAVDWLRLRRILVPRSGMIGLLLIGVFAAWISTLIAPATSESLLHPVVERIVVLTTWIVVMMACGTAQLLGWTGVWIPRLGEPTFGGAERVRVLNFEPDGSER